MLKIIEDNIRPDVRTKCKQCFVSIKVISAQFKGTISEQGFVCLQDNSFVYSLFIVVSF